MSSLAVTFYRRARPVELLQACIAFLSSGSRYKKRASSARAERCQTVQSVIPGLFAFLGFLTKASYQNSPGWTNRLPRSCIEYVALFCQHMLYLHQCGGKNVQ